MINEHELQNALRYKLPYKVHNIPTINKSMQNKHDKF